MHSEAEKAEAPLSSEDLQLAQWTRDELQDLREVMGATSERRETTARLWAQLTPDEQKAAFEETPDITDQLKELLGAYKRDPAEIAPVKAAERQAAERQAEPASKQLHWLEIGSHAEVARKVIRQHLLGSVVDEGKVWLRSPDGLWREVDKDRIARWIARWDGAEYENAEGKLRIYKASAEPVLKWIHSFRARKGSFFAKAPRGVPFKNCFLDMTTRTVRPLRNARQRWCLPFEYSPDACLKAPPAAWLNYLESIWGDDQESIFLVHEMLAYLLTGKTDLQKIFLLIGAKRSGKGTLLRMIKKIFGDAAGPFDMAQLGGNFGKQSLLGKIVAYDSDFRRSTSAYKDEGAAVAFLLKVSGEDEVPIPQKHIPDWTGRLPVRLMVGTNPPFALSDVGDVFASRLIILTFPVSFFGREDLDLDRKLEAELPAIVDLALRALPGLEARGHFIEPASSRTEREAIERAQDPMKAFIEECCEVGEGLTVQRGALFKAACRWREDNGHKRMSSTSFGEYLRTHHSIGAARPNAPGKRAKLYTGIRLAERFRPDQQVIESEPPARKALPTSREAPN